MMLTKANSNMTSIWHCYTSFFPNSRISSHYNDEDLKRNQVNTDPPDFSDFKDPWEDYTDKMNFSASCNSDKNNDDNNQCNCDTEYFEQFANTSDGQFETNSVPSKSLSMSNKKNDDFVDSLQALQISRQEYNHDFAEATNIESNVANEQFYDDETTSLVENLNQISNICNFIEKICNDSEERNPSEYSFNTKRCSVQQNNEQNNYDDYTKIQKETDVHESYPQNNPLPCKDSCNVATQSKFDAGSCIESKSVSNNNFINLHVCSFVLFFVIV